MYVMLIMEVTLGESLGWVYSYSGEHLRGRNVELKGSVRYMVLEKEKKWQQEPKVR